ncbi:hypothetical protein Taro_009098 [Colocasia esculenta]|uniref:R13L1/DRL21-like LRR repeat region domain-containing protein n=1 Tax=Colocasia esculenta TaxID=4460 RepID=A0A843U412_COLES|nr:hypothetical protein [Colocasia esculenta]
MSAEAEGEGRRPLHSSNFTPDLNDMDSMGDSADEARLSSFAQRLDFNIFFEVHLLGKAQNLNFFHIIGFWGLAYLCGLDFGSRVSLPLRLAYLCGFWLRKRFDFRLSARLDLIFVLRTGLSGLVQSFDFDIQFSRAVVEGCSFGVQLVAGLTFLRACLPKFFYYIGIGLRALHFGFLLELLVVIAILLDVLPEALLGYSRNRFSTLAMIPPPDRNNPMDFVGMKIVDGDHLTRSQGDRHGLLAFVAFGSNLCHSLALSDLLLSADILEFFSGKTPSGGGTTGGGPPVVCTIGQTGGVLVYELPNSIGDLKYLRYINLDGTLISCLPESICKLYNLQTLSLKGCGQLGSFGKLTSLRTLDEFPVIQNYGLTSAGETGGVEVSKELNHLSSVLVISRLHNVKDAQDAKRSDLRKKREIKELVLGWDDVHYSITKGRTSPPRGEQTQVLENLRPPDRLEALQIYNFKGLSFPSWMVGDLSSLSRLAKVVIQTCNCCTPLPPLGQLPCLRHLEINDMYLVEAVGCEFYGPAAVAFPKLEELKFCCMWSWVSWEMPTEEQVVFPRLRFLLISYCPRLKSMVPLYLLRALEVLTIEDCKELISIDLGNPGLSSSDLNHTGLPPLRTLRINRCPQARFSPKDDEHLSLPTTFRNLTIKGSPLLVEWCERCPQCQKSGSHVRAHDAAALPFYVPGLDLSAVL